MSFFQFAIVLDIKGVQCQHKCLWLQISNLFTYPGRLSAQMLEKRSRGVRLIDTSYVIPLIWHLTVRKMCLHLDTLVCVCIYTNIYVYVIFHLYIYIYRVIHMKSGRSAQVS